MSPSRKMKYGKLAVIRFAIIVLFIIGFVIGVTVGGSSYMRNMQSSLWDQLVSDVIEVTQQGAHSFDTYLSKEKDAISKVAADLARYNYEDDDPDSADGREAMIKRFNAYTIQGGIFSLVVCNDEDGGWLYTANDEIFAERSMEELTPQQFQLEYGSYTGSGIARPYLNNYTGERTLGYYSDFYFADGRRAIVRKGQLSSFMRQEFSLSFFNGEGFSYIIDKDGEIVVRSTNPNSNRTFTNVFDIMKYSNENSNADVDRFRSAMIENKHGSMRLKYRGSDFIYSFVPLEQVNNAYLVSAIPNSVIAKTIDETINTSQTVVVVIVIMVAIIAVVVVMSFVVRRRMALKQAEVRHREQLFGILASNTSDVFIMMSHKNKEVEYVSPNITRLLGYNAEDVMDDIKAIDAPLSATDEYVGLDAVDRMPEGGTVFYESVREHKLSGEKKHFRETIYRTEIDGVEKDVAVISDCTADKRAQAALRDAMEGAKSANKAKSMFLSNMSHDIRTPMNAIIGFTELIRRSPTDADKVMEYTGKISSSGQHLLGLINDVLDMSKIESGKTVLNIAEFNLAGFVDELIAMVRPQAKAKMLDFNVTVSDVSTETLLGDKLRLNQILINILSNAIKYTPEGGAVTFDIAELPATSDNYAHLCFTVKDNGIGISEEYAKQIFLPFTREASSTVSGIQGTGLGMAITKNLVDLMGGNITLESKLGEGSTFKVDLELRISEEGADKRFWTEYGIKRILVVDDEEEICQNIVATIGDSGPKVEYCLSGEEAVELAHKEASDGGFDLVLLDMRMPGLNGVETARKLRKKSGKDVRLILLTSYDWTDFEGDAKKAGINAFMPKPFFVSNLINTVHSLVKRAAEAEEQTNVLEGKRFLAAEDNELNSEILVELLDMIGVSCDVAPNGQAAVEMFEKSAPGYYDVVLMDVQMPVLDGYGATRAIRASSHPDAEDIPIIAMTANAFAEDVANALDSGMDAHVAKPIDMKKLEETIKLILKKRNRI